MPGPPSPQSMIILEATLGTTTGAFGPTVPTGMSLEAWDIKYSNAQNTGVSARITKSLSNENFDVTTVGPLTSFALPNDGAERPIGILNAGERLSGVVSGGDSLGVRILYSWKQGRR